MKRFIAVSTLVLTLLFPAGPVLAAYTITIGPFGFEFSEEFFPFYVFLIISLTIIALFLIFRAIVLWYWKINKIVETLQGILDQLRIMNRELVPADGPGRKGESEMDDRAEPKVG